MITAVITLVITDFINKIGLRNFLLIDVSFCKFQFNPVV